MRYSLLLLRHHVRSQGLKHLSISSFDEPIGSVAIFAPFALVHVVEYQTAERGLRPSSIQCVSQQSGESFENQPFCPVGRSVVWSLPSPESLRDHASA